MRTARFKIKGMWVNAVYHCMTRTVNGERLFGVREKALKVLEREGAILPKATVLRCRVRYFTDGAILGSEAFVRGYVGAWQLQKGRKHAPRPNLLRGVDWEDLATIRGLRKQVFG